MKKIRTPRAHGQHAELLACQYLKKQGLNLITRNYSCRQGEIDLIMKDSAFVVFVEVRKRQSCNYGDPIESVTYHKQQKLIKTGTHYLVKHGLYDKIPCRFDIVGVTLSGNEPRFSWVKNAF